MSMELALLLVILCPLFGATINGFALRKFGVGVVATFATLMIFIPFIFALMIVTGPVTQGQPVALNLFDWISVQLMGGSSFTVPFAFVVDRLSGTLLLIITGVGSLIHMYAGVYMNHEEGVYRFFAYLNLFVFSMLCLALGSNMLVTFLGWEGVGLCSYLLIGYWFEDVNNAKAGMKAFIANRVGDLGFVIAMFLCITLFGTLTYADIGRAVAGLDAQWFEANSLPVTLLGLCLLLAVTGKSAQMPLYVWLPDAMAGPTPVSALIHAATMVTAGVYLMVRMSFLLVHSHVVMTTIACVGGFTALFAATIGLVQTDIKKVLAYSTVSQLGFMVLACGVGAFEFGVAHLMTHAFFKALLFLGAGSVIYAMHHEQDLRKMGGLIKKLPITGWTFVIGTLAIIGFPGFSGFFSKDEILYYAWTGPFGHPVFWIMGALAAACTSFYMVRLTVLVFFSNSRVDHHTAEHLHENPVPMVGPLVILAILSIIGGYVAVPHVLAHAFGHDGDSMIVSWLAPVLEQAKTTMKASHGEGHGSASLEWGLMGASVAIMLVMSTFAIRLYRNGPEGGKNLAQSAGKLYDLILNKWKIDELYHAIIIEPLKKCAGFFYQWGDRYLIEGIINDGSKSIYILTTFVSDLQTGLLRGYVKLMFVGLLFLGLFFIF